MRKKPFISVAMTTYNGAKYLEMQLQSLRDQITQLNEKITKISEANNRSIEENILSNNDFYEERADKIAQEALY